MGFVELLPPKSGVCRIRGCGIPTDGGKQLQILESVHRPERPRKVELPGAVAAGGPRAAGNLRLEASRNILRLAGRAGRAVKQAAGRCSGPTGSAGELGGRQLLQSLASLTSLQALSSEVPRADRAAAGSGLAAGALGLLASVDLSDWERTNLSRPKRSLPVDPEELCFSRRAAPVVGLPLDMA